MSPAEIEVIHKRIGFLSPDQVAAWRLMGGAGRLEIAFQAYQFALEMVRVSELQRHPDLSDDQLTWRVLRRMQRNQRLGR